MRTPPIAPPRRAVVAAALLYLSVASSIGALTLSRFDLQRSAGPDITEYLRVYRGTDLTEIPSPYRYRILVPALARAAPDIPRFLVREGHDASSRSIVFKFAVVNLLGLASAALMLFRLMQAIGLSTLESLLGGLLFLAAFHPLTIGTLPLVDAWAYALLAGALYALVANRRLLLFLFFTVGMLTKETTLLVPLAALLLPTSRQDRWKQLTCFAPAIVAYAAFRALLAPTEPTYSLLSTGQFLHDLFVAGRHNRLLWHGVQAFGLLWALGLYGWLRLRRDEASHPLIRWTPLVLLILLLPFTLALHVGRVWFFAFPVVIPLAVVGLRSLLRSRSPLHTAAGPRSA